MLLFNTPGHRISSSCFIFCLNYLMNNFGFFEWSLVQLNLYLDVTASCSYSFFNQIRFRQLTY